MTPHVPTAHHGHLQSSNSTANIFLGGVRRSWMDNPPVSRPPAVIPPFSSPAASASIPAAAPAAVPPVDSCPGMRNPVRVPVASSSPSTSRIQQNDGVSSSPQPPPQPHPQSHLQSQSQSQPQPQLPHQTRSPSDPQPRSTLMSPATTGPSPPSRPSSHPQPPAVVPPDPPPLRPPVAVSTNLPPPPTQSSQLSPTPSLSLSNLQVSSARPNDSPTSTGGRDGPRPFVPAFPSPSNPPTQVNAGVPTPPPTRTSAGSADDSSHGPVNNATVQNGSRRNSQQMPQSVQTTHAHPAVARQSQAQQEEQQQVQRPQFQLYHHHHHQQQPQQQQRSPNAQNSSTFVPTVDATFFQHSIGNLNNFMAYLERTGYHNETFEFARLQLLTKACVNQDCLYLAIHQVYCLYSFSRPDFFKLPGYTELQARGLEVIERVMVENSQLSPEFLRWCAHFPGEITILVQTPAYQMAVQEAALCLGNFAERWKNFIEHVFARRFPPFVGELVEGFRITSTALAYTIFLSTCRQLPGPSDEPALKKVWDHDLQNFQRRCMSGVLVSKTQIRQENGEVIRMYQSIPNPNQPTRPGPPQRQQHPRRQQQPGQQNVQPPNPAVPRPTVNTTASVMARPTGIPSPQPSQSPQMPVPQLPATGPGVDARRSNPSQTSPSFAAFPLPASHGGAGVPGPGQPATQSPRMATGAPSAHPMPAQAPRPRGRPRKANGAQPPHPISIPQPRTSSASAQMGPPFPMLFPSQLVQAFSPRQASSPTQQSLQTPTQTQMVVWPNGALPPGARAPPNQQPPRPTQVSQPSPPLPRPHHHPLHLPAHSPASSPLLPPPGHRSSTTTRPNPLRDALHQAHLRGPVNEVHAPPHENDAGLFQYISGLAVKPVPLGTDACAFKWQFELSHSDIERVPASQFSSLGQRAVRAYKDGSQIHRLRCIRVSPATSEVSEQTWCTTESIWPSVIYVFINDVEAFVRRRVHNGKDLPLDISHYLREGLNTVSLHFIRSAAESRDLTYAMAVEVLDIVGFSRAKELAKPLASAESREQIRTRLSPAQQDDDEVSIVSDNLTIDLVDPFMARVFDIPVRGRFCGHRECFDHDTWILTRASKSGNGPMKEDWKCPICHQDARPQSLVVDGFLFEVREELARTNRLEAARAIQVKADGSWQVRAETEASDRSVPDRTASKRKLNGASVDSPASQRPKVEQGPSLITNGEANAQPTRQQTLEVIALD